MPWNEIKLSTKRETVPLGDAYKSELILAIHPIPGFVDTSNPAATYEIEVENRVYHGVPVRGVDGESVQFVLSDAEFIEPLQAGASE